MGHSACSYSTAVLSGKKKGYAAFSGNAGEYHGWYTLQLSLMFDEGLGTIMTGETTAPEADASEAQV